MTHDPREALEAVKAAILEADIAVVTDTLWMPERLSKNETVVDYIDAVLTAPAPKGEPAKPVAWQQMESAPKGEPTEDVGCRGASEWFIARLSGKYGWNHSPVVVIRRRAWPQDDHWEDNGETCYRADYFDAWRPLYTTPPPAAGWDGLPSIPDNDADFTPGLARKIIAKYQQMIEALRREAPASSGVVCANCNDPLGTFDAPLFCGCCRELGADRPDAGGGVREALERFETFLNEPPEYEAQRTVRDYRHEAYREWSAVRDAVTAALPSSDERPMPLSDINDLDDVCRELGIQDSHVTPAEAVRELNAEIERLNAALSTPSDAVNGSAEARLRDHKWFDHECQEKGCQSLVWKDRYEAAVKGRADFRNAFREERNKAERMREALTPSGATKAAYIGEFHFSVDDRDEEGEECTRMVTVPWTTTKEIMKAVLDRALSASGDEAKKSEGGVEGHAEFASGGKSRASEMPDQHGRCEDAPGDPGALSSNSPERTGVGIKPGPSDPPDRREIVARIIDPDAYNGRASHRDMYRRWETAIAKADHILVQDEAAIRADEREQCAIVAETCTVKRHWQPEIAAAIRDRLAALDGGR